MTIYWLKVGEDHFLTILNKLKILMLLISMKESSTQKLKIIANGLFPKEDTLLVLEI